MLQDINLADFSPQTRQVFAEAFPGTPLLTLGARSYLVNGSVHFFTEAAHILVGRYSSLGHWIDFYVGMNHDYRHITNYPICTVCAGNSAVHEAVQDECNRHQIVIGSDVWVGAGVTLMGGVHIGSGAVIGAGAVVAKDVPPYAIAVGNPARIIKYRFDTETITRLLRIQWWNWSQEEIERYIPMFNTDMAAFLERFDPGVQEPAADETAAAIRDLRTRGYAVSYFIPDFEVDPAYAVWERVIDRFLAAYTAADRAALVLAVPDDPCVQPHLAEICRRIAACGTDAPLLLSHSCTGALPFSIPALRASDVYITTREVICSVAMDDAADAHLAIRYGGDQGRLLFPPV